MLARQPALLARFVLPVAHFHRLEIFFLRKFGRSQVVRRQGLHVHRLVPFFRGPRLSLSATLEFGTRARDHIGTILAVELGKVPIQGIAAIPSILLKSLE